MAACALLVFIGWAWRAAHREPEYEGRPASAWIEVLANPTSDVLDRDQAERALFELGTNAVPALVKALKHDDSSWRQNRQALVARLPEGVAKQFGPNLPPVHYRRVAARMLYNLGTSIDEATPYLASALSDPDRVVRGHSYDALRRSRAGTPVIIAALTEALRVPDETIRVFAAGELGLYGTDSSPALPVLIETLNDPNPTVRLNVIHTLGRVGRSATNAIPALLQLLSEPKVEVRLSAATAITRLDPRQGRLAIPTLIEVIKSNDVSLMEVAIEALGDLGAEARSARSVIEPLLSHEDPRVQRAATMAMRRIGFAHPLDPGS